MLIFILFSTLMVRAQSLDQLYELAYERSSTLKAQEMEEKALSFDMNLRGKWQNPQLMSQVGTLKSGAVRGATVEVSLTQAIPLSDKYSLRKEIGQAFLTIQTEQKEYFKKWIQHQVALSAWRAYFNYELLKHGQERAKRLQLIRQYARTRPTFTSKQKVDISLIESSLLVLERMQDEKAQMLEISLIDLEFWTGKKINPEDLKLSLEQLSTSEKNEMIFIEKDQELKLSQLQLKQLEIDQDLASKERRPDLFIGGGYRVENVSPVNHFSYAIIGLNIPLWDRGVERFEASKARFLREKKNNEEIQKKVMVKHRQQQERVKFQVSQAKRFHPKILSKFEGIISESERGFKQGVIDVNTFLLSETQSHEVIDQVYISWMNYLTELSTYKLMRGEALTWN